MSLNRSNWNGKYFKGEVSDDTSQNNKNRIGQCSLQKFGYFDK